MLEAGIKVRKPSLCASAPGCDDGLRSGWIHHTPCPPVQLIVFEAGHASDVEEAVVAVHLQDGRPRWGRVSRWLRGRVARFGVVDCARKPRCLARIGPTRLVRLLHSSRE